ncbi:MAG: DUF5615 family PIN-like protein [Dehalococcoidia bacterium]
MKFKVDKNLPVGVVVDLRAAGHDAHSVHDEEMVGAADSELLAIAQREGRVFLTFDKGIADVREYPPDRYAGIVLFRPSASGRGAVLTFVRRHLPSIMAMEMAGHLFIVSEGTIRRR